MKYPGLAATLLVLSACTVDNPLFAGAGGGDGGGSDGGGSGHDLAGGREDLATAHDLAAECAAGERTCSLTPPPTSERCAAGSFVANRHCPSKSACMSGYCQPPSMDISGAGTPCDTAGGPREGDCLSVGQQLSCQPFIDPTNKMVSWFCDTEINPNGFPGTPCTSGSQCRSGFCGSNGTCYRACQSDTECPQNGGQLLRCRDVNIEVEGVPVTASSCVPN